MSLVHSPSVNTSSLLLYLDAANIKSYSGTGTNWIDLTNTCNGISTPALPTYSSDGGGCFDFTANTGLNCTTAVCGFQFLNQPIPTTGGFTINCWVKNVPTTVGQQVLFSNTPNANGYRFGIGTNGIYWLIGPTYLEGTLPFTSFTNTQWNNVCCVFDRQNQTMLGYLNGVFQSSQVMGGVQTAWTTAGYTTTYMGSYNGPTFPAYSGKLAKFEVYGYALSAYNIQQNFQTFRGRFGI